MKKYYFIIIICFLLLSFINVEARDSNIDKMHFLKLGSSDAIIVESDGHYGLIDSSNPSDATDQFYVASYNGNNVKNYLNNLIGNKKLDFIILTHNHSDHIGGIPDIVDFVDNKTVIFYKNYYAIDEEETKWNNKYYYNKAIASLTSKNAEMLELSESNLSDRMNSIKDKNDSISSMKFIENPFSLYNTVVDDTLYFKWGNFEINLYNLYHISNERENLNSIITLFKRGKEKILLTGDIETTTSELSSDSGLGVENQIADVVGNITVLKAAHHGYGTSNSLYMLKKLQPEVFIIPNSHANLSSHLEFMMYYLNEIDVDVYESGNSNGALVLEVSSDNISVSDYNTSALKVADAVTADVLNSSGWISANNYTRNDKVWMYIGDDSKPLKGFNSVDYSDKVSTYYFDKNGIMYTGFLKNNDYTYYFSETSKNGISKGEMLTGWQKINGNWYYFSPDDNEINGYLTGTMVKGWQQLDYNGTKYWFYFVKDSEVLNYSEGQMLKGRHVLDKDGKKSYFYFSEKSGEPEGYVTGAMISNISYQGYTYDSEGRDIDTIVESDNDEKVEEVLENIPNTSLKKNLIYSILGIIFTFLSILVNYYSYKKIKR